MIDRNGGDILYSFMGLLFPLPEILGAVDSDTHSFGFIVAGKSVTISQLFTGGAEGAIIHEGYHFLGCGHDDMEECYRKILETKALLRR